MSGFDTTKYAYKLQDGKSALDTLFGKEMAVNEQEMSITFPFASGVRRDGVGDMLEVGGIKTERHLANPLILCDHAKAVTLPIGMAEDPKTGEYTVHIDSVNKVATAKAFIYQGRGLGTSCGIDGSKDYDHAVFCEQLFDLVAKKFIRAGSIGYQVIAARELYPDYQTGIPKGMHLLSVLMLEASIVVLPANQDTVIKMLSMKSICGKPTSFYLKKSLAPYAPPRKAQMGYEGRKSMTEPASRQNKVTSGADATNEAIHTTPAPFRKAITPDDDEVIVEAEDEGGQRRYHVRGGVRSNGKPHRDVDSVSYDIALQTAGRRANNGRTVNDQAKGKHFSALALYEKQLNEMEKAIHMPQTPLDITPTLEEIEEGIKALISACKKPRKRVLPNLKKVAKWKSFNQGDLVRVTFHDERGKKISKQNGIYESGEADHHFVDFGNGKPQRITPKSRAIVELSPASELGEVDDTTRDLSELPEAYYLKDMEGMSEGESAGMGEIGEKGSRKRRSKRSLRRAERAMQGSYAVNPDDYQADMIAQAHQRNYAELMEREIPHLEHEHVPNPNQRNPLKEAREAFGRTQEDLSNPEKLNNQIEGEAAAVLLSKKKKCMDCGNIKKRKRKKALSSYQRLKDKHSEQKDAIKELHNYIGELLQ